MTAGQDLAGELLAQLEKTDVTASGGPGRGNKTRATLPTFSEYRQALDETGREPAQGSGS